MFAHAISSTIAVTPRSSVSGGRASRWTELWPRPPGSTPIVFCLKRAIVCSLMPFCSGASTSLRIALIVHVDGALRLLDRDAGLSRANSTPSSSGGCRTGRSPARIKPRIVIGTNTSGFAPERRAVEAARRDADDRHRLAVDDDRLVEHGRARAEPGLPVARGSARRRATRRRRWSSLESSSRPSAGWRPSTGK